MHVSCLQFIATVMVTAKIGENNHILLTLRISIISIISCWSYGEIYKVIDYRAKI